MSKYYSIERIKKVEANYKMLLGGRNIGKSYAVKHDVIKECFEKEKEFIYLRRWDEDIKARNAINYFSDVDINKITEGRYNSIYIYQSSIFLANEDKEGKIVNKKLIGRTHSLNQAERYKSQIFLNVDYILFEEFITDKRYLNNEPEELQEYVSTIFRDRVGVVYLIGNTISKLCPYFSEWKLSKILKMKIHDICLFENTTNVLTDSGEEEVNVTIAVEMCGAASVLSKMAFGNSADMIIKNKWRTRSVSLLDKKVLEESDLVYTVYLESENLIFRLDLYSYNDSMYWYVRPQTRDIKDIEEQRVITSKASLSPYHSKRFKGLSDSEQKAFNLISQGKIYYCSTSCGSDFEQALKKFGILTL